jgi:ABC-type Fe3+/spermidine/putrescine transport system ATPase subunit
MIATDGLTKRLGEFELVDASVTVEEGEYFVLLGPTGAGKTIFVECIAGIHRPESGRILIDGEDVTRWLPEQRRIGYVPQDYALFPHLSGRGNIGFGLRIRRVGEEEIARRTQELADLFGIDQLLDRPVRTLSGGERQRVALARALAIRPSVLLLDEPLSAVDEQTREALCVELKRIHRELRTTTIHISHNFEETLSVADRIGVISRGRLQQVGTPADIFRRPANEFVARFVRSENVLTGAARLTDRGALLDLGGAEMLSAAALEGPVTAVFRPEEAQVLLEPPAGDAPVNVYAGSIEQVLDRGSTVKLWIGSAPPLQAVVLRPRWLADDLTEGKPVWVHVPPAAVHLFSAGEAER